MCGTAELFAFFFVMQETADEMRISDWSSDVCSSDLKLACVERLATELGIGLEQVSLMGDDLPDIRIMRAVGLAVAPAREHPWTLERAHRTEGRRGGKECVSTCRSRWATHLDTNKRPPTHGHQPILPCFTKRHY